MNKTYKIVQECSMPNKDRVTRWLDPEMVFTGKYGKIKCKEWLEKERKRIMDNGNCVAVILGQIREYFKPTTNTYGRKVNSGFVALSAIFKLER